MKRRAKLSLKKSSENHKRRHVAETPRQNDGGSSHSGSLAGLSGSAPKFVIEEDEQTSSLVPTEDNPREYCISNTEVDGPSVSPTFFASSGDWAVSASQDCPMSCDLVTVNSPAGSGHQMETETILEGDDDNGSVLPSPSASMACSERELDFTEDVQCVTDPIFEREDDLWTQVDEAIATHVPSSGDNTQFKQFSTQYRSHSTPSIKRQTSLLSFLSRTNTSTHASSSNPIRNSKEACELSTSCSSSANNLAGKRKGEFPTVSQSCTGIQFAEHSQGNNTRVKRTCPFYKRIPGTGFSVDAFSYGSIPDCSAYFLSHFHADHYMGLTKRFQHPIYCSKITANLVKKQLRVSQQYVYVLDLNFPHIVDGVEVTLLDANHCPGSVLFLFRLTSGRHFLHTGDFRFCAAMKNYPQLTNTSIHQIFLDTTYCSPQYTFPRQDEVITFAVDKAAAALHNNPGTLIVCGTYTIGKERVFMGLAETLGLKVFVKQEKKVILECLESPEIMSVLTSDPCSAGLHVLPMGKLNLNDLSQYLEEWSSTFSTILAFKPTGWTYSGKNASLASIKPRNRGPITIYGIPYSEHSSFSELRQFVQFLRPQRIIPTVNNHSAKKREEMQQYFKQWLANPSPSKTKQTTLSMAFRTKV